jgi:hypothetical protein
MKLKEFKGGGWIQLALNKLVGFTDMLINIRVS